MTRRSAVRPGPRNIEVYGTSRFRSSATEGELTRLLQATVEDLDPPPARSCAPTDHISSALQAAYERDYTHLTVVSSQNRALLGYLAMPRLREMLASGSVSQEDPVSKAMQRFARRGKVYRVISMATPLEELEDFFEGTNESNVGRKNDFAVVTDPERRFVLGVATRWDLEEFVRRRPA